ncbi:hypothetical protein N7490_000387 [Penicillium lividum]|nr:hypothetical protein N7490_000387 [Penicillium lividum]
MSFNIPSSLVELNQVQEISFIFGFFSILLYHTRHQVPIYYRKFHKKKVFLYVHLLTGLTEAFRYRILAFKGDPNPLPTFMDVLSCFIWSWSSLELVKTLRRGDPRTTRPPYQAGALLRPVVSLIAYFGIPSLHRLSISALDSFLYARLGIFFFTYTGFSKSLSPSGIYAVSIPLAAFLSIHEGGVPGASLAFVLAVALVMKVNEWVTHQSRCLRESKSSSPGLTPFKILIYTLVRLGLVELEELRELAKVNELEKPVNDEYVSAQFS